MSDRITIRPATPEDGPLLFALFAEEKAAELAPLGLSTEQLQPLLEMQYRGREFSYSQAAANPDDEILCLADGSPVGRMLVDREPECFRVMDVAVLAAWRNRGIATEALRRLQADAVRELLPVRLRVMKNSAAERLYQRLGFDLVSSDEISHEMKWLPVHAEAPRPTESQPAPAYNDAVRPANHEDVVRGIVAFLRGIGLEVEFGAIPSGDFLPGIQMISSGLRIDLGALLYPGDLLHEAGHLAVMTPSQRISESLITSDAAEEMGALAWSYAAALRVGIDPQIVFHEHGYRGQASQLLHDFAHGKAVGLPYLWWIGMTTQPQPGEPSIYPRMLHWLRQEHLSAQVADSADYALQAQL